MKTEIEELEAPKTELTVIQRAALALGVDEGEKELIALSKKYVDIKEIKNPAGRQQCHAAAMELGTARIATTKTGETAREDANAFQKAVIAEVKRRVAIVSAEETRLLALRDAWDKEREAEKIAKALAESKRITEIRQKIDAIRNMPQSFVGTPSSGIGAAADHLSELVLPLEVYAEYTGEAQAERDNAVKQLRAMQEAMRTHEAAQEALILRQAELAEQERVAAAARAAQEEQDRKERERIAEDQREAQERAADAMRAQQAEHEARMRAQQEEIDRKQSLIDSAIAEQERIAQEAREAAEAEERRRQDEADAAALAEEQRLRAERDEIEAAMLAESARVLAERKAAEAESERRGRVNFIANGPAPDQIIFALAGSYNVEASVALNWLALRDWKLVECKPA